MRIELIIPVFMIVLSVGASVVCFWQKDWRRGLYWAAAAILTLTVTFDG